MKLNSYAVLIGGLVGLSISASQAQTPQLDTFHTNYGLGSQLNGRLWMSLSDSNKSVFLLGFAEYWSYTASGDALKDFPARVPFGEIQAGLDQFYQLPENLPIPVVDALYIFGMKVRGEAATAIEIRIGTCRKLAGLSGAK